MYKTILLAVVFALMSSVAMAQVQCGQRENIVKWLAAKHKEGSIAFGVTTKGSLIEVLSTKNGETWTIIVTSSEGSSCIVAVGEGWRSKEYQEHFAAKAKLCGEGLCSDGPHRAATPLESGR